MLAPPNIRLDNSLRKYTLRLQKLSPIHPVNQELTRQKPLDFETPRKAPPKTQLQRIQNFSLSYSSIEEIQHFKFPPWEPTLPFQVVISSLSKEEEAQNHLQQLQKESSSTIRIYSDASFGTEGCQGIGVGLFAFASPSPTINYQQTTNLGSTQLVYDGEFEGIAQAVEFASLNTMPNRHFRVFSDNRGALLRLQTLSDDPSQAYQLRILRAAQEIERKGATLDLN